MKNYLDITQKKNIIGLQPIKNIPYNSPNIKMLTAKIETDFIVWLFK